MDGTIKGGVRAAAAGLGGRGGSNGVQGSVSVTYSLTRAHISLARSVPSRGATANMHGFLVRRLRRTRVCHGHGHPPPPSASGGRALGTLSPVTVTVSSTDKLGITGSPSRDGEVRAADLAVRTAKKKRKKKEFKFGLNLGVQGYVLYVHGFKQS